MARRPHITLLMISGLLIFFTLLLISSYRKVRSDSSPLGQLSTTHVDHDVLHGEATATKLENSTLKAELGRSAWMLLHTMMAKFPDKPTPEDSEALTSYIYLFARLYPCGECARHFQQILKQYPPQVATRSTAAVWACHVHNQVNKRLKKELFECSKIGDFYDCGCADASSHDAELEPEKAVNLDVVNNER